MACFHPLDAWQAVSPNSNGKRPVRFKPDVLYRDYLQVPCGQCIGCRLERSRQWAMRCVHEASLYDDNCFITLTYDDEHLPSDGSLRKRDFQNFMKRLRKQFGANIRFYHCGEYGNVCEHCGKSEVYCSCASFKETIGRPHYHACIFNFDFADKELFTVRDGVDLYRSHSLDLLWPFGYTSVGAVTFESAAYVARYILKKVNGDAAEDHYTVIDRNTGEVHELEPEYTTMSRRPGVGKGWYERFKSDVYPSDEVVLRGRKMKPPKFYDKIFQLEEPERFERIKAARVEAALAHEDNNTPERLKVRERVKESKVKQLKRGLR